MTRAPEWDDYSRSRALALLALEDGQCPGCRNYDSIVPSDPPRGVKPNTTLPDGRVVQVSQFRCFACGLVEVVKRDWMTAHEKDEPIPGRPSAGDGRMFVAQLRDEEVPDAE